MATTNTESIYYVCADNHRGETYHFTKENNVYPSDFQRSTPYDAEFSDIKQIRTWLPEIQKTYNKVRSTYGLRDLYIVHKQIVTTETALSFSNLLSN